MAKLDLTPKQGMSLKSVLSTISDSIKSAPQESVDTTKDQITQAVLAGVFKKLENGEFLGGSKEGEGTNSLVAGVTALKHLHDMDSDDRKYLNEKQREAAEEADRLRKQLAAAETNNMSGLAMVFKAMMDSQANSANTQLKMTELMIQLQQQAEERNRQLLEKLTETLKPKQEDDPYREFGRQAMLASLNRDTKKEITEIIEMAEKLRPQTTSAVNPELLATQLNFDLERFKTELEHQRELRKQEQAGGYIQILQEAVPQFATALAQRSSTQPISQTAQQVQTPPQPLKKTPNIGPYRYRCGGCGEEFLLSKFVSKAVCPYCNTEIVAGGNSQDGNGHAQNTPEVSIPSEKLAQGDEFADFGGDGDLQ